jgi:hypothetical protein
MERNSNGIKLSLFGLLVVLLNLCSITASKCDRTPEGFVASKSPANGKFRIRITGNPDRYSPGQVYQSEYYCKLKKSKKKYFKKSAPKNIFLN